MGKRQFQWLRPPTGRLPGSAVPHEWPDAPDTLWPQYWSAREERLSGCCRDQGGALSRSLSGAPRQPRGCCAVLR